LLLVGDGPLWADLHALVKELRLCDRVHFAGYQADPARYLQVMNVFALPSRAEGLPLTILEAWAAGLPVVATRVGGIPRLVEDGRTGLLINVGDEEALTAAIGRLLSDSDLARRIADAGRDQAVEHFDTRRMAGDYQRHYLELLTQGRTAARCAS
jgi:glycosyltransferase involved in cell wall biosynthesis